MTHTQQDSPLTISFHSSYHHFVHVASFCSYYIVLHYNYNRARESHGERERDPNSKQQAAKSQSFQIKTTGCRRCIHHNYMTFMLISLRPTSRGVANVSSLSLSHSIFLLSNCWRCQIIFVSLSATHLHTLSLSPFYRRFYSRAILLRSDFTIHRFPYAREIPLGSIGLLDTRVSSQHFQLFTWRSPANRIESNPIEVQILHVDKPPLRRVLCLVFWRLPKIGETPFCARWPIVLCMIESRLR